MGTCILTNNDMDLVSVTPQTSCGNHRYPSSECRNFSCFEGHIDAPSDHAMQEIFIQYFTPKTVSYVTENVVDQTDSFLYL